MTSKLDYLKKYMAAEETKSDLDKKGKKKKKKKKVKDPGGFRIVDNDHLSFGKNGNSDSGEDDEDKEEALALMTTSEELPQVAGVVDDSRMRTKFTTGGWKDAFEVKQEPPDESDQMHDNSNDDKSPPKRRRHDSSNDDKSPQRRRRHDSSNDDKSPQRRRRHDSSNDDKSPQRRRRHDSSNDDKSPPRRKRHDSSNDDRSRKRTNSDGDMSPPRKIKQESDSDISPPRVDRKQDEEDSDLSPPRIKAEVLSDDDNSTKGLMKKTLDGKKAGLQNAKDLKAELNTLKEKERDMFRKLSSSVSGRDAETKVRGRLKEKQEEERLKKEKADAIRKEVEAKYAKWNKGLKQLEANKIKIKSDLHEMDKPLARDKDDEDLDAHLKAIERDEDPMLQYMRSKQKKSKAAAGIPEFPRYKGPPPPPNRFGIPPGYRWDGVDRSTGFEKRLFEQQSKRKALAAEAYAWSTEDM